MDTSDDAPNTEGPRKKRAMGLDEPQDTTLSPPPAPLLRDGPTRIHALRYPHQANKWITAKVDETDELRVNLDFVSLGMISESQPQSNAPENTANIAPKRPAGQKNRQCCKQERLRRFRYQLDHEIVSFYDWAKPQEIENIVR
ncbi:hypothetical protein N7499_003527 [Penicillium canescens]|nr:hypothetical protein N7499_003527 [Penicillium canescens]